MDGVHNICTLLLQKPRHKLPGEVGTEQLTFANAFQNQMKEAQSGSPVMRECGKDHVRATPRTLLNSKPRPRPPQEFGDGCAQGIAAIVWGRPVFVNLFMRSGLL